MTYFWTADEHYRHANIIEYTNRPFDSVEEMDETIIARNNKVVRPGDTVIHVGDFTLAPAHVAQRYIDRLNGKHIFLKGSHDRWLPDDHQTRLELRVGRKTWVIADHYCLRTWPRSHYNTWHVYGHSHGKLPPIGKSWDVGVDNNDFYPVSLDQLRQIMAERPDNPNLVKKRR